MRIEGKPLCIALYAGLHGWEEGFVSEGYRCVGFDIVDMCDLLGLPRPPNCHLVIQDVLTLHALGWHQMDVEEDENGDPGPYDPNDAWCAYV